MYAAAGRSFTRYLPDQTIYDLIEDGQGRLLVAAGPAGVLSLDISGADTVPTGTVFDQLVAFGSNERTEARSLETDRFGNLWIGTYDDGLIFRNGRVPGAGMQEQAGDLQAGPAGFATVPGHPGQEVRVALEDGDRLWLGSDDGVYCVERRGRKVTAFIEREDLEPLDMVRALAKDEAGNLWVGTYGGGLAIYDPGLQMLARYDGNDGLGSDTVNQLLRDSRGRIWAATTAGLA